MQSLNSVWQAVLDQLDGQIGGTAMNLWIRTITPIRYEDNCFVLAVHSPFQKDIIMSRYRSIIKDTLSELIGFEVDINVLSAEDKQEIPKSKISSIQTNVDDNMKNMVDQKPAEYTFDNFIVGESNKHAHAACLSVARNPARSYNPLFIYGNTGLGKTHLLKAISAEVQKNYPTYKVLYVKGEEFTNDLIDHLQNKNMTEFKNKYRTVDVLLVDDQPSPGGQLFRNIEQTLSRSMMPEAEREAGLELVFGIMVMYAVAEPYALQIEFLCLELVVVAVAGVILVYSFQCSSYLQVVFAILVKQYVATFQCCLRQVVEQCTLLQRQLLESGYLVSKNLQVGESLYLVGEIVGTCFFLFLYVTAAR